MAWWSMLDDRFAVDIAKSQKKAEPDEFFIDLDSFPKAYGAKFEGDQHHRVIKVISNEDPCCLDQFLHGILKKIYSHDSFRPIPPMLGNGHPVDLKTLFLIVMEKGGYDEISKNNLWNLVGEKSGLGTSAGSYVKLIYCKYLGTLETWLMNFSEDKVFDCSLADDGINFHRNLMKLQVEMKRLLMSNYPAQEVGDKKSQCYNFKSEYDYLFGRKLFDTSRVQSNIQDSGLFGLDMPRNLCNIDDKVIMKEFDGGKMIVNKLVNTLDVRDLCNNNEVNNEPSFYKEGKGIDNDDDVLILDPSSVNKENFRRKRKRKSMLEMLCWVTSIAKNPQDPAFSSLLGKSKWSSQSDEEIRKQVLLFREAVFMKENVKSRSEQHDWQGKKMHPCMYDDNSRPTDNLRERLKCLNKKILSENFTSAIQVSSKTSIGTQGDLQNTQSPHIEDYAKKTPHLSLHKCSTVAIPLGPTHQAFIPK